MIKTKSILLLFFIVISDIVTAEEFEVVSFRRDISSLVAIRNPVTDINGRQCAVIRVLTDIKGLSFSSNQGIEGEVKYNQGEYWVYVQPGEKQIVIKQADFKPLYFVIEVSIESGGDYIMELRRKVVSAASGTLDENLVKITFRLNEDNTFISKGSGAPMKVSGRVVEYQLPKGEYNFTFSKDGFDAKTENIKVDSEKIIDVSLAAGINTTKFKLPGIFLVDSDPTGAIVFLNGQKAGVTPINGQQIIAGEYQLLIQKELYYSYSGTFTLKEGETKELPVIDLKPKFGYMEVKTLPEGASIYLDDKLIGTSPVTRRQIESGNHVIRSEYDLYHTDEQQFLVNDGDEKAFSITLKAAYGTLIINSEPEGSTLLIDGVDMGKTPFKNEKWPSGTYQVTLKNSLYLDESRTVIVEDGQTEEQIMVLSQNFGKVSISAPDAKIYQDGSFKATGSYVANLAPGKYLFKAMLDKHHEASKEIFVTVGSNDEITLAPEPMRGSVGILTDPAETKGAEIFVNGVKQKQVSPAVLPLLIGDYKITVKKDGFLPYDKNITIKEGEAQQLQVSMQTYRGSLQQDLKKHKTQKLVWLGAATLSAGAATYFLIVGNQKYEEYQTAGENASDLRKQVETYDILAPVCYGVSVACLVPCIIQAVKQKNVKKKMNLAVVPVNNGMLVNMTYRF